MQCSEVWTGAEREREREKNWLGQSVEARWLVVGQSRQRSSAAAQAGKRSTGGDFLPPSDELSVDMSDLSGPGWPLPLGCPASLLTVQFTTVHCSKYSTAHASSRLSPLRACTMAKCASRGR